MKIENIEKIVFSTIDALNQELNKEDRLKKSLETRLFGGNSNLDSLDLINLVVAVEQNIEDEFDVTITLADERAMSQETSPFKTVGTLTDYIEMILEEKLDD